MSEKADKIRDEHNLVDFHKDVYNRMTHHLKIEGERLPKHNNLLDPRDRAQTMDDCQGKVPLVRASFVAKKPMNKNPWHSYALRSVLEFSHENYDDLIGYIDALGIFCINNKEGFDKMQERIVTEQLRLSNNSIFEFNPVQQWKNDMRVTFNMITDILINEINKNKYCYKHQQNLIVKILKWNFEFENDYESYFDSLLTVSEPHSKLKNFYHLLCCGRF